MLRNIDAVNEIYCYAHPKATLIEDYRAGDQICSECGLVVGDRVIDVSSEWRTFSDERPRGTNPSRVGKSENPLLNGTDLFTHIGSGTKYYKCPIDASDKILLETFSEINNMADRIHLPKIIVDRTKMMFKKVHDINPKGCSNDAIASACLYIACRQEGVPRTFKEICAVSKVRRREIGRCFKLIVKTFETNMDLVTTNDFMSRFCSTLGLSATIRKMATQIATKAVDIDIVPGRSPISVAAAAIYMASQMSDNEKRSMKEIGDIAGVTDITIGQSYKQMYPHASKLV